MQSKQTSDSTPAYAVVHTAGPWRRDGWDIVGGDNSIVAKVLPWDESGCRQEDQANANLVAAAPELLEACKLLLRLSLPVDVSGQRMVQVARDAVKKAINKVG
jgi:hypothetical protein